MIEFFLLWIISIHAAREGGDNNMIYIFISIIISIHAAREGGDRPVAILKLRRQEFQSTPPVKAATFVCDLISYTPRYFNPRRP